ncbi:YeeE/YedE family protein [Halorutilales archaeon Cl-col2-1]
MAIGLGGLVLSVVVGTAIGIFMQKGRFCFVHALRDFIAFKDTRVTKGVVSAIGVTMLLWAGVATALGGANWWTSSLSLFGIVGGIIFGVSMTYAGGCASGTLYRAGEGYVQFWITLVFMGVGYIVYSALFPTLSPVKSSLTFSEGFSLFEMGLPPIVMGVIGAGVIVVAYVVLVGREVTESGGGVSGAESAQANMGVFGAGWNSFSQGTKSYISGFFNSEKSFGERMKEPWSAKTAGIGIGFVSIPWFVYLNTIDGYAGSYIAMTGPEVGWLALILNPIVDLQNVSLTGPFGYIAAFYQNNLSMGASNAVVPGAIAPPMLLVASLVFGAFLASLWSGEFDVRMPKKKRVPNAVLGGLGMGVGSRMIPGCNIANIYSGLSMLTMNAVIGTVGMIIGVYIMTHWMYRDIGCEL